MVNNGGWLMWGMGTFPMGRVRKGRSARQASGSSLLGWRIDVGDAAAVSEPAPFSAFRPIKPATCVIRHFGLEAGH